ncbi:MAG: Smr/MutS family protein [Burkholderiales bacterium]
MKPTKSQTKAHSLADLAALKKTLERNAREAARQAALAQAQAAAREREQHLFANTVGPVTPVRGSSAPVVSRRAQPTPEPRQTTRDEASVLAEALSDDFDVESLLDTDAALSFRRRGVGPEVTRKLRRGVWAIQAQLDLHGLRRDAAREQLSLFFRQAHKEGLRCVRVIHGKGNGSPGREPVLKSKVRSWLVQKNEVMAFTQARASDGGHGAMLVLLRSTTSTQQTSNKK